MFCIVSLLLCLEGGDFGWELRRKMCMESKCKNIHDHINFNSKHEFRNSRMEVLVTTVDPGCLRSFWPLIPLTVFGGLQSFLHTWKRTCALLMHINIVFVISIFGPIHLSEILHVTLRSWQCKDYNGVSHTMESGLG